MPMLLPFVAALALSLGATPVVRWLARRHGFLVPPKSDRWHRHPTALLGGVAVFVATIAAVSLAGWQGRPPSVPLLTLAVASVAVFGIGLVDDVLTLSPAAKLALQIGAASVAVWGGVGLGWTGSLTLDALLSIFWLIGVTNAFNLLDNMDGACAGVGSIAAGVVAAIAITSAQGSPGQAVFAAALCGALLGFLVYNFHPASIFLGDSGSLFIGFLLAGLTVMAERPLPDGVPVVLVVLPVLVVAVPIFDTTLVTVSRKLSGRPASRGGTDHTAHRLVRLGFSETKAVAFLYGVSLTSGIAAVGLARGSAGWEILVFGLGVALVLLAVTLLRVRTYGGEDFSVVHSRRFAAGLVDFLFRRHAFELLLDLMLVAVAYYTANRLRFEAERWPLFFPGFLRALPLVIACHILGLLAAGAYGRMWRYFSVIDLVPLAKGVGLGSLTSVLVLFYLYQFNDVSRAALFMHAVLLMGLLAGSRLAFRLLPEVAGGNASLPLRALAYGAGDAGDMLVRELAHNTKYGYRVFGFLDDDPMKLGRRVRGVPILGQGSALSRILKEQTVDVVILSAQRFTPGAIEEVRRVCTRADVPVMQFRCALEPLTSPSGTRPAATVGEERT